MSVRRTSPKPNFAASVGEHISLETDLSETRAKPQSDRAIARYELSKGGRRVTTGVSILEDHYVLIETQRSSSERTEHTVDLRFVDPNPIGVRKVAWRFLQIGIAGAVLTALAAALYVMLPDIAQRIGGLWTPIGLGAFTLGTFVLCFYLTTESLFFVSVHGRARVIVITGLLGTIRRAKPCVADIVIHTKIAHGEFKQTRQAYLRDEMREHSRLRDQGALSEQQYDDARSKILRSHA